MCKIRLKKKEATKICSHYLLSSQNHSFSIVFNKIAEVVSDHDWQILSPLIVSERFWCNPISYGLFSWKCHVGRGSAHFDQIQMKPRNIDEIFQNDLKRVLILLISTKIDLTVKIYFPLILQPFDKNADSASFVGHLTIAYCKTFLKRFIIG